MGIEMKELSDLQREIVLTRLPDEIFSKMPEAWILALDSKPVAEWPLEMLEAIKDYLPMQTQD